MKSAGSHSHRNNGHLRMDPGRDLASRVFRRILLIKPSSLGDVIHALPVLHGLRTRYPDATIDWLIASSLAPLVENLPELNEVIRFDRRRFGRMASSPRIAGEFARFVHHLRRRSYDLVLDLQGLFRSGFLAGASGAPVRIGFRDAREGARLFYTNTLPAGPADVHAISRNYSVARLLGFSDCPIAFPLALTSDDRASVARLLQSAGIGPDRRLVAVVPGARWETKIWAAPRFAETINRLHSTPGIDCVLLGGPDDVDRCSAIAARCDRRPTDLSGRTDLRTLAAAVERADIVVGLDSGVMHLAVALDRPLVCLIGPTNHLRTGPYNRPEDCLRLDLACAPCYFRRLSQCPHEHRCMTDLPVERVIQAVRARLRFHGGSGRGE